MWKTSEISVNIAQEYCTLTNLSLACNTKDVIMLMKGIYVKLKFTIMYISALCKKHFLRSLIDRGLKLLRWLEKISKTNSQGGWDSKGDWKN